MDIITGELRFIYMMDNYIAFWDHFGQKYRKLKWGLNGHGLYLELVK